MADTVITTSVPRKNSSSSAATVTPSTIPVPSEREKAESNRLQNLSDLVNKGNTCYANAILQCLNAFSKFSHVLSSISNGNNKLSNALLKIFYKLRTSKTFVDPSAFLKSLSDVVIKSGNTHFEISSQQDAPEILLHLLGECE